MTSLSIIECCHLLIVDPKTLRQWLTQAQIPLHAHLTDARIKCLTGEQVFVLAHLHDLVLQTGEPATFASPSMDEAESQKLPADADLRARLAHMEAQMATLQTQLTDLTLQLLREREQHTEQRLLALEAQFPRVKEPLPSNARRSVPGEQATKGVPCRSPRKQTHLIPLIEYGASGQYVLICPEEGERHITPDSPPVVCVAGDTQLIPLPGPARTSECLSGPRTVLLDGLSPHSWPVLQLRFREYEASDYRSPGTHGCYPSIPRPIPPETEQSLFPSHA